MNAKIKSYKIKIVTKGKESYRYLEYVCDCITEKGEIKERTGSMTEEYARKYFKHCGKTTKETIGTFADAVLAKRQYKNKDGENRQVEFIKFLNLLDKDGKPILMEKEAPEETTPDF